MDHSSQADFSFVNLTHPDDLKDEETQSRIRRLAMTQFGRKRRKTKDKQTIKKLIPESQSFAALQSPAPFERIGSGDADPFAPYPIKLDGSSKALVTNIFRKNSSHSTLLRGSWYPVGLSDAGIFHIVLSNSQLYRRMETNPSCAVSEDAISLVHLSRALKIVNEKLNDPTQHTSYELLGAVAAFMYHDLMVGSFEGWARHRTAMLRIIELRGGLDTITREFLRISLSWCELAGAFSQDIPTILPMPRKWEADSRSPSSSPRPYSVLSLVWKQHFPMRQDWISVFDDVTQLIFLDQALTEKQMEEAIASGSWVEPTMIRLLSIRPLQVSSGKESVLEEVCRLGTMLFLAPVWRSLGAHPVWTSAISRNLLWTLSNHTTEWLDLKPLLIWTVYFAAIETVDAAERAQFVFILAVLMAGAGIRDWNGLMHVVKSLLWVEQVFAGKDVAIRDEVMGLLTKSPSVELRIEEEGDA